jgi:hypothetical protein
MDPARIYFLGHSLGAMVGTTLLAFEPDVRDAVLVFSGTSLPKILDGSSQFGSVISAGLAANGVVKGTPDYEAYLMAAQTTVDSGDPVNHATAALDTNGGASRGILLHEIVGDGAGNPSDLTVPNTVPDANDTSGTVAAPLAGTEPQIALMGLTQHNSSQTGSNLQVVTKFTSGYHGSLIDNGSLPVSSPLADPDVTAEIQGEIASFLASDGNQLTVTNPSVLQAP